MSDRLSYWKQQADTLALAQGKPCVIIKSGGSYQVWIKDSVGKSEYVYDTSASDGGIE